jgi:hypothetical protein
MIPIMDLEAARKALSKGSTFSTKRVAFFGVVGLCVVAGIFLRSGLYFTQPEAEQNTPATSSSTTTVAAPAVDIPKSVAQPEGEQNAPAATLSRGHSVIATRAERCDCADRTGATGSQRA